MMDLIPRIQRHFDMLQDRMLYFVAYESQCEGWFKGELFVVLTDLAREGSIKRIVREDKAGILGRKRVDLMISADSGLQYIELKHWLIGSQKGQYYGPEWYASVRDGGIIGDVEKLSQLNQFANSWLLLLLTANPGLQQWEKALQAFNTKMRLTRYHLSQTHPCFLKATL